MERTENFLWELKKTSQVKLSRSWRCLLFDQFKRKLPRLHLWFEEVREQVTKRKSGERQWEAWCKRAT